MFLRLWHHFLAFSIRRRIRVLEVSDVAVEVLEKPGGLARTFFCILLVRLSLSVFCNSVGVGAGPKLRKVRS